MAISKRLPWLRRCVSLRLTELGYEVQVYGQTVMRALAYREARRFAASLRRALRKQPPRVAA